MHNAVVDAKNAAIVPRENYSKAIEQIIKDGKCPFCKTNLLTYHREPILFDDGNWMATRNSYPYEGASLHFLLISRAHRTHIETLTAGEKVAFFEAYNKLSHQFEFFGASILFRSGDTRYTGASVGHLHAHVIVGSMRVDESRPITGLVGFGPP